ncbi:MAG: hypothetical protein ABL876_05240 [Chitinophagaceae bacterium]
MDKALKNEFPGWSPAGHIKFRQDLTNQQNFFQGAITGTDSIIISIPSFVQKVRAVIHPGFKSQDAELTLQK